MDLKELLLEQEVKDESQGWHALSLFIITKIVGRLATITFDRTPFPNVYTDAQLRMSRTGSKAKGRDM